MPRLSRRAALKRAGAAMLLAAAGARAGTAAAALPATAGKPLAAGGLAPGAAGGSPLLGYAFGTAHQDVTIFDVATRQPLVTRPLGATVRWLSNEQTFWDGRYIWTYDFPDDRVDAIAIDPREMRVVRRIATDGEGPAHSLMLDTTRRTAWVNVAGANELAVIDTAAGQVIDRIPTGDFP